MGESLRQMEEPRKPTAREMGFGKDVWFCGTALGREVWSNGFVADLVKPHCPKMLGRSLSMPCPWKHKNLDSIWPKRYYRRPLKPIAIRCTEPDELEQVVFENDIPILVNEVIYDYFACRKGVTFHASKGLNRHRKPIVVLRNGEPEGMLMPMWIGDYEVAPLKTALAQLEEARP